MTRTRIAPWARFATVALLAAACSTTTTTDAPTGGTEPPAATTTTAGPNYDIFSPDIDHHAHLDVARALTAGEPLTAEERAVLGAQLITAREVALRNPTVADGLAAGLTQAGGYYPMQAAHFADLAASQSDLAGNFLGDGSKPFDPTKPLMWLYGGTDSDSQVVGLMYYAVSDKEPVGFAGTNDKWHTHTGVCFSLGEKIEVFFKFPVEDTTEEECLTHQGAQFMDLTGWMLHVWVVPGWENPIGVFNDFHINLRCPDGTVDNIDEFGLCVQENAPS